MVRESERGETGRERYSRNHQSRLKRRSNRKKSFYLKMTFKRKSSLTFLSSLSSSSLPSSLMSLLLSLLPYFFVAVNDSTPKLLEIFSCSAIKNTAHYQELVGLNPAQPYHSCLYRVCKIGPPTQVQRLLSWKEWIV